MKTTWKHWFLMIWPGVAAAAYAAMFLISPFDMLMYKVIALLYATLIPVYLVASKL